jgi:hypothetical protein
VLLEPKKLRNGLRHATSFAGGSSRGVASGIARCPAMTLTYGYSLLIVKTEVVNHKRLSDAYLILEILAPLNSNWYRAYSLLCIRQ